MNFPKLSTYALIAALATTTGAGFLTQAHAANPVSALLDKMKDAKKQKQPHMRDALKALEAAKASLKKATDDKGSHKAPAQKAIDEAIEQVKAGIAADNSGTSTKEAAK